MYELPVNKPGSFVVNLGDLRAFLPPTSALGPRDAMPFDKLALRHVATPVPYPPSNYPPGHGRTFVRPGTPVESSQGQTPGAGFEGRVAQESLQALVRAGGVSYAYTSRFNGDREVNVWAPPGFDPSQPFEVLLYNRGIQGDNAGALEGTHIASGLQDLNTQGRNVLLVLPKSPQKMETWFAPPEDAGALLAEAQSDFNQATGMALGPARETWLMAHSGGGKSVANMFAQANPPQLDKILLADSTYGQWAGATADALQLHPGPRISVVVTDHNAQRAEAQLGARGIHVDHMPAHWHYDGHNGVPAYMLDSFLSGHPTLGFSSFQAGTGWALNPLGARDTFTPTRGRTALPVPTAEQAPNSMVIRPAPGRLPTTLCEGAEGIPVRALQLRLKELGYKPGPVDGFFGPLTRAAVETMQRNLGLVVNGEVDGLTRAAMAP